jgi:hypothetical protein
MIIIILLIIIVPGIIATFIYNVLLKKTGKLSTSTALIFWAVFSFFILFSIFSILYLRDRAQILYLSPNEGSDFYRVSFITKFFLLSLGLSILFPFIWFLLENLFSIAKLFILDRFKKRNIYHNIDNQEEKYIVNSINYYFNLSDKELQKLSNLKEWIDTSGGIIYLYSPLYSVTFKNNKSIKVLNEPEDLNHIKISGKDRLIIIGDEIEATLIEKFSSVKSIFITKTTVSNIDPARMVILPLFFFRNDIEKEIERNLLQSTLAFLIE